MTKQGVYNKYQITKTDGSEMNPDAVYFVLRIDNDISARLALRTYAKEVAPYNPELSEDLLDMLDQHSLLNRLLAVEDR